MASRRQVKKAATRKGGALGKLASGAATVASFVPGPIGAIGGIAKNLMGGGSSAAKGGAPRRKGFSIARMQKRLIQAKLSARIQRARLSAFKGI